MVKKLLIFLAVMLVLWFAVWGGMAAWNYHIAQKAMNHPTRAISQTHGKFKDAMKFNAGVTYNQGDALATRIKQHACISHVIRNVGAKYMSEEIIVQIMNSRGHGIVNEGRQGKAFKTELMSTVQKQCEIEVAFIQVFVDIPSFKTPPVPQQVDNYHTADPDPTVPDIFRSTNF